MTSRPKSTLSKAMMGRRGSGGASDGGGPEDLSYEYRREVGNYIRDLRDRAKLTQAQLAEHLGMGASGVSGIELGRSSLAPEHYATIAKLFGVEAHELAQYMLRYTNPWLFSLLTGSNDKKLKEDFKKMSGRVRAGAH